MKPQILLSSLLLIVNANATIYLTTHAPIWGVESQTTQKTQCHKITGTHITTSEPGNIQKTVNFLDKTGLSTLVTMFGINKISNIDTAAKVAQGSVVGRAVIQETDKTEKPVNDERCYKSSSTTNSEKIIGYNNCGTYQNKTICIKSTKPIFMVDEKEILK